MACDVVASIMARTISGFLLLALFLPAAHASSILVNGGFETGDFTGWTQSGWFIDTLNPNSGVYDASTGCSGASCTTVGDPNSAYLYQDVATTPGTTYALSFFYDAGQLPTFGSELLVLWGDPTAPSLSNVVDFVDVDTSGAYAEYTSVTATSATSQLEFLGRQDLDFYYLDGVSVTASGPVSSVPEPESLGLMLAGTACAALFQWVFKKVHTRPKISANTRGKILFREGYAKVLCHRSLRTKYELRYWSYDEPAYRQKSFVRARNMLLTYQIAPPKLHNVVE